MTNPLTDEQEKQIWEKYFGDKKPADIARGHESEISGIETNLALANLKPSPVERVALVVYAKKNIIWMI